MITLVAAFVDAAVVLALGLAANAALRGRSAALRHAVLASAIVTAALMPALKYVLPQFPLITLGESARVVSSGLTLTSASASSGSAASSVAMSQGIQWARVIFVTWIAGALVICAGLVAGLVRLARLRARCVPVHGAWRELADALAREYGIQRRVSLLMSDDPTMLVTCGVLKPGIILPAGATAWADDRCRSVLRHELAHIARHDAAMQIAGEVLRAAQWMNPLAWIACRRLRHESEYACDDAVLSGGIDPTEYATHLLDVARLLSGRHWIPAPAIAEPSTLERRIVAMLHERRNRTPLGRRGWLVTGLVALIVGVPLAAAGVMSPDAPARPPAPAVMRPADIAHNTTEAGTRDAITVRASTQGRASLTGIIQDQFGGRLPAVTVTMKNPQAGIDLQILTDPAGSFVARDVPAGQYAIRASLPGFMTVEKSLTLAEGEATVWKLTMPLGTVQETNAVTCSSSEVAELQRIATAVARSVFPVLSAQEQSSPMRVGGNVRMPLKLQDVKPVCPSNVPQGETQVRLVGHIGTDGRISDAALAEAQSATAPPSELIDAALDAVRGWVFRPTLLDGEPVAVTITVNVTFKN